MTKETSSHISTIAAQIMRREHVPGTEQTRLRDPENLLTGNVVSVDAFNRLLDEAKTLAGSCLSQDETPGQEPIDFLGRLQHEREQLNGRLEKLTNFLATDYPRKASPIQMELLEAQRIHMSEYLAVLDARLADLGISERSAPVGSDDRA